MTESAPVHDRRYVFADFELDSRRGSLARSGQDVPLRPKSFEMLRFLLEHQGELVSKDTLHDAIWGETVVGDDSITQCLIEIRRALDDNDRTIIRTVPKRGYLFELPVRIDAAPDPSDPVPRGRIGSWWSVPLLIIAVVAAGFWIWRLLATPAVELHGPVTEPAGAASIAVLPFLDLSENGDQQYFSDGIAEEVLNLLAQQPGMRVIARTSSFSFRDKKESVATIASALNVGSLLEGSVRRSGSRVRITVQLIDASNESHLWSATFEQEIGDVLDVQDEIAAAIVSALRGEIVTASDRSKPHRVDPLAYDQYLRGRDRVRVRTRESIVEAVELFDSAAKRDPDFARAWAWHALATLYSTMAGSLGPESSLDRASAAERARQSLNRALEIDPDLAEAHVALGTLYFSEDRFEQALASHQSAVANNPALVEAYWGISQSYEALGYLREAVDAAEQIQVIDPIHPGAAIRRILLGCRYGVYSEQEIDLALRNHVGEAVHGFGVVCTTKHGRLAEAFRIAAKSFSNPAHFIRLWTRVHLKDCSDPPEDALAEDRMEILVHCGHNDQARALYASLSGDDQHNPWIESMQAVLQIAEGDYQAALDTLHSVFGDHIPLSQRGQGGEMVSHASHALNKAYALRQIGREDEAQAILDEVRKRVDRINSSGLDSSHRLLEAKLLLLEGKPDQAIVSLDRAFRSFKVQWMERNDPVLIALLGRDRIMAETAWLDQHIDAERAKLGWPPASF